MNKITLSYVIKTLRPYTIIPNQSYQKMLGDIFSIITKDKCFYLESTCSSRIMNNEYDVPIKVRNAINNDNLEKLKSDLILFLNRNMNNSQIDTLRKILEKDIISANLSNDFKTTLIETKDNYEFLYKILFTSFITDNRMKIDKQLLKNDFFILKLESGDIISMAFNIKECKNFKIVVIPVDDEFTMILSKHGDNNPLISKDSIHGKWLTRLFELGFTSAKIKRKIEYIDNQFLKIGKFIYNQTEFWLIPTSHLGKRNKSESSKNFIEKAVDAIIDEYDISGQGEELLIPLLGSGRARVFTSNQDSINFISEKIINKSKTLKGKIKLIIYKKDINK